MKGLPTRIVLAAFGVLMLSGGVVRQEASRVGQSVTAAERQVWLDSLAQQWPDGIVPIRESHQDAPVVEAGSIGAKGARAASSAWLVCPPMFELEVTSYALGHYFDEQAGVTQLFTGTGDETARQVMKYEIDSGLGFTSGLIAADSGGVWLAEDLDQDGDVELVMQYGDELKIFSAPGWELRSRFVFPGMAVVMYPVTVNIDDDPYLEIYATPNTWGEDGLPTIIKYDEPSDSFKIICQMWAPNGAIGDPAVGDFDEDGRIEFISGNNQRGGYEMFEWQESVLVHIGSVGSVLNAATTSAAASRPKPGGQLHALLGYSLHDTPGTRYELLEPVGDNAFTTAYVFEDLTYYSYGHHPCCAADTDCDGLDEMAMCLRPIHLVWEWDPGIADFVSGCEWSVESYGTTYNLYTVDLDQDGALEWGCTQGDTQHPFAFRSFPDPECDSCDVLGHCTPPVLCYCKCFCDPQCDGQTNVLDVVHAVNVAFRDGTPEPDPFPQCPDVETTDVDCTGATDVLDVLRIVNVAFRGGDPAVEFCDPCE